MTKYRGNLTLAENTPSTNVAENTPFRQMTKGEMLTASAIEIDDAAVDTPPNIMALLQIGRTVLFSGPINQQCVGGVWGRNGIMAADRLFHGPVPVSGTLNLQFTSAGTEDVLWELGGEVYS